MTWRLIPSFHIPSLVNFDMWSENMLNRLPNLSLNWWVIIVSGVYQILGNCLWCESTHEIIHYHGISSVIAIFQLFSGLWKIKQFYGNVSFICKISVISIRCFVLFIERSFCKFCSIQPTDLTWICETLNTALNSWEFFIVCLSYISLGRMVIICYNIIDVRAVRIVRVILPSAIPENTIISGTTCGPKWINFNPSRDKYSLPGEVYRCIVEVWECISNAILHFTMDLIIYPCCDQS